MFEYLSAKHTRTLSFFLSFYQLLSLSLHTHTHTHTYRYGDSPSTDVCTSPKTLVVIEMRESDSPIVSGAHNECEGSTSLQDFLTVVSSGVESKRQSGHFSEFLAELISHGT
jgi:hypothetical protein